MAAGSQEYIRDMNRRLVLKTIIQRQPLSRANLAKELKLTKATISAIVQELIDKSLVEEIGSARTAKGRKPILLQFNQKCGHIISMDLALHKVSVMISDLKGENCIVKEYPVKENIFSFQILCDILLQIFPELPSTPYGIVGISMGIHGVVRNQHVLFTPYYKIKEENIAQMISDRFQIPVFLENEANLCALGEALCRKEHENLVYINVHAGIGTGIILNGNLFHGKEGYAGEIGHTILFPKGKPCPCGNFGCLEQYASEKAILEEFSKRKNLPSVSMSDFLHALQKDDPDAKKLTEDFIFYMSIGINNILHILNPDVIILNSALSTNIPHICQKIQDAISSPLGNHISLITGEYQDIAELLGGVKICLDHFIESHSQIF